MKKLIIVLFLSALIIPVFAQNNANEVMYYVNVPVEKIYPSSQGYIVQFRSSSIIRTIGIPNEWFTEAGGRADLVYLPTGSDWPTMSVFYKNGEFSHIRLYAHRAKSHWTWGSIPLGTDLSRFFVDSESFEIQY